MWWSAERFSRLDYASLDIKLRGSKLALSSVAQDLDGFRKAVSDAASENTGREISLHDVEVQSNDEAGDVEGELVLDVQIAVWGGGGHLSSSKDDSEISNVKSAFEDQDAIALVLRRLGYSELEAVAGEVDIVTQKPSTLQPTSIGRETGAPHINSSRFSGPGRSPFIVCLSLGTLTFLLKKQWYVYVSVVLIISVLFVLH